MVGPLDHRSGGLGGLRPSGRLQVVSGSTFAPARRAISVLYVEDDADDVYLLGRQLEHLSSFQAEYVHTPTLSAARSMLARHRFDIVLCDFWLGSETTIALIDELKSSMASCPVVLVSSLENDDIELIGRRAGAAGFVAKADLSAASLERIFSTLLNADETNADVAPDSGGVSQWLKALLRSLDRVHAASALAKREPDAELSDAHAMLDYILSNSAEIREDVIDKLAGLQRATRAGATTMRFDAVPYLIDAVRALGAKGKCAGAVEFTAPLVPILIETSPTTFGDLLQGFFAEATDFVAAGTGVRVLPSVRSGFLHLEMLADPLTSSEPADGEARTQAAAAARRFLIETLARASGGLADFADDAPKCGLAGRLQIPLRLAV